MTPYVKVGLTLGLVALAGCAGMSVNTPSGTPSVTIKAPKKLIMDRIANGYSAAGYQIKSVNDYTLVVEQKDIGSTHGTRETLSFSEGPAGTQVTARTEYIADISGPHEDILSDTSDQATELQQRLEKLKTDLESGSPSAPKP